MQLLRLALVVGACSFLAGCKGSSGGNSAPSAPAAPPATPVVAGAIAPPRRGFDYGYFWSDDEQVLETADHTTIIHIPSGGAWTDEGSQAIIDTAINRMKMAKATGINRAVLTMDFCGWYGDHSYRGSAEAYRRSADYLRQIAEDGLLEMVVGQYTVDEPEREADVSAEELTEFCGVLRDVNARFAISPALCIIYGDGTYGGRGRDYRALAAHDWVGRDAYDEGAGALGEPYSDLAGRLAPNQRLILVPGVASPWKADLAPWYERAQADDRVVWLCPFDWVGYAGQPNGARHNGMAAHCREYGKVIKGGV